MKLKVLQLYPRDMNIYGDLGNALVLKRRGELHGYQMDVVSYNIGDVFPTDIDIIIGGGGQDSGQARVGQDLAKIKQNLLELADKQTPMLMICGMYQLFGNKFITMTGQEIEGIGLFDLSTIASNERMVGNISIDTLKFGRVIGYENHSGLTTLGAQAEPFGKVLLGAGNNNRDQTEGILYKNAIGTYLHGPLLPKNPQIADWMIEQASINKFGNFDPKPIDDSLASLAREIAFGRPR